MEYEVRGGRRLIKWISFIPVTDMTDVRPVTTGLRLGRPSIRPNITPTKEISPERYVSSFRVTSPRRDTGVP